jgi:hypothetical protein
MKITKLFMEHWNVFKFTYIKLRISKTNFFKLLGLHNLQCGFLSRHAKHDSRQTMLGMVAIISGNLHIDFSNVHNYLVPRLVRN